MVALRAQHDAQEYHRAACLHRRASTCRPSRRCGTGDIFMGSFGAEQVMYNHFGYRSPIGRLYMAGSACHPAGAISGGSGYISAGLIARDLGLKLWWKP